MCKHYGCEYYCPKSNTCDYMLITGERRGCPPTDDCNKYCTDPAEVKAVVAGYIPRIVDWEAIHNMERVYVADMETKELARQAKVSVTEALFWTRKVHPESNVFLKATRRPKGW